MAYNQWYGQTGEDIAVLFFQEKGFEIVERNWRCPAGEIDLIIRKDGVYRFIEVKTRTSTRFGYPEEAVTSTKREHLYAAVENYLTEHQLSDEQVHVDILAIILNNSIVDIQWIEDLL